MTTHVDYLIIVDREDSWFNLWIHAIELPHFKIDGSLASHALLAIVGELEHAARVQLVVARGGGCRRLFRGLWATSCFCTCHSSALK